MKKLLLTALSAAAVMGASAAITGTYTAKTYTGYELTEAYTFAGGEVWTSDDEDAESWEMTISEADGVYTVENLLGWEESLEATYDEATGVLSIAGGAELGDGYCILGGLGEHTLTAQAIMNTCDQYGSYVPTWDKHPVTLAVDGNNIVVQTPILIYYAANYTGFIGYAYEVVDNLSFGIDAEGATLAEYYKAVAFKAYDPGDDYTFAGGTSWSSNDGDAEPWTVTVKANEDGTYTLYNLLDWEEEITATWDAENGVLTIAAGTEIYEDTDEKYLICGGLGEHTLTAQAIMSTCDQYGGYVPAWEIHPVTLAVVGDKLVAQTPVFIYIDYTAYSGYIGYVYEVFETLEYKVSDGEEDPGEDTPGEDTPGTEGLLYSAQATVVDNDPEWFDSLWCDEYYVPSPAPTVDVYADRMVVKGWCGTQGYDLIIEWNDDDEVTALTPVVDGVEGARGINGYVACGMPDGRDAMMYIAKGFAYADADEEGGYLIISGYFSDNNAKYFFYELEFEAPGTDGIQSVTATDAPVEYYNLSGMRIANPAHGQIVIKRQGGNVSKVIVR